MKHYTRRRKSIKLRNKRIRNKTYRRKTYKNKTYRRNRMLKGGWGSLLSSSPFTFPRDYKKDTVTSFKGGWGQALI